MTLSRQVPLQFERPLYVKIPFRSNGRNYTKGQEFPWMVSKVDKHKVQRLYAQGFLHHNESLEKETRGKIGDGLNELSLQEMYLIVDDINAKVKEKALTDSEFKKKKCHKSPNSKDKQMGMIRRWRSIYGDME